MAKGFDIHFPRLQGIVMAVAVVIGVIVVAAVLAVVLFMPTAQQDQMQAEEKVNVTMATEGTVIPETFGDVRLPGNLIWWDNLLTVARQEEVGGKGGSQTVTTGYDYYIDMWQVFCMGTCDLIRGWKNDKPFDLTQIDLADPWDQWEDDLEIFTLEKGKTPVAGWNDGTDSGYPDWENGPGIYANNLPGIAHAYWSMFWLGENVTYVPTVHAAVRKDLSSSPLSNHTLSNGSNPAAICVYILMTHGVQIADINMTITQASADYWYAKGYGLNIPFTSKRKTRDQIGYVLSFVGGAYGRDNDDKHYIKAFDKDDSSVDTINTEDFIEFTFTRRNWYDTYNDFKGTYIDAAQEYTKRTIGVKNIANQRLQGRFKTLSLDLSAFRTVASASKRLWEIMKTESYPYAMVDFTTNMSFFEVLVGEVVTINNTDYGISAAKYRVISKEISDSKSNEIKWSARQMVESLVDENYDDAGDSLWSRPDYKPDPLVKQAIFELPYTPQYGHKRTYLMLAARENSFEAGWLGYVSFTGSDYLLKGSFRGWAQNGTLDETYVATTNEIDDEIGILYTPYREDPQFDSIGRTELFILPRFAIIGDEVMRFQTVTAEGASSFRLTGVVRGCFNTAIVQHNAASTIWLVYVNGDNLLTGITADDFYVKMLPYFQETIVDPADATAIHTQITDIDDKASTPEPPSIILATRSGSSVTLKWYPTNQDNAGAGRVSADSQTDQSPMLYDQDFETYNSIDGIGASDIIAGTTDSYNTASAFYYYVRSRYNGKVSSWVSVYVNTSDGDYTGPEI